MGHARTYMNVAIAAGLRAAGITYTLPPVRGALTSAADMDTQIRRYHERVEGSMPKDWGVDQEGLRPVDNFATQAGLQPTPARQDGLQPKENKTVEEAATAAAAESMMLHIA
jgi:hypothetical protein